mmetsp:Transcript_27467/g.85733  ORF Transcript_27467/g.85733 Transcript_27467/m.85733 type:complete len:218 (+) Transcript_27467:99-752(+)
MRALMRKGGGGRAPRARSHRGLDAELLHGVEARGQLRDELPRDREHGHAAVVQLLAPHLLGVLVEAEGVAVAARLVGGLDPPGGLEHAHAEQQDREAGGPLAGAERRQARGHLLKPGQLRVVRRHGARGRHHGDPAVLDLRSSKITEACLVADLAETERIKVAERHSCANLLCGVERRGRRRALRRLNGGDRGQGPAPLNSGGCRGGSRKTPCVAPR